MSKDKGSKNHKKAPADKSSGKGKALSAYKSEGKIGLSKQPALEAFIPKPDFKGSGSHKS
jgi:hypothetical protein